MTSALDEAPRDKHGAATLDGVALACRRGDRLLFSGLDICVAPGQIVWLRGSNGRGKTSLLRMLAALSAPESGELLWAGQPLRDAGAAYSASLLYIAHGNALKDDLSAIEALAFLAQLHDQDSSEDALMQALQRLGMRSRCDAPVRTLSQGQRRRVALARLALAPRKPLWLLDEPYDALDDEACRVVNDLLRGHARSGGSVVLTSHLPLTISDPMPTTLALRDIEAEALPA